MLIELIGLSICLICIGFFVHRQQQAAIAKTPLITRVKPAIVNTLIVNPPDEETTMTAQTDPHDGTPDCDDDYDCHGYAKIKLKCRCNCPQPVQYADYFVTVGCEVDMSELGNYVTTYMSISPTYQFGSVIDLGHNGWLIHVKVPV